jgi:hypothetical protein
VQGIVAARLFQGIVIDVVVGIRVDRAAQQQHGNQAQAFHG